MKKTSVASLLMSIIFIIGCVSKNIYFEPALYPEKLYENRIKNRQPREDELRELESMQYALQVAIEEYNAATYPPNKEHWADIAIKQREAIDDYERKIYRMSTKEEYKKENIDFSKVKTIYLSESRFRYPYRDEYEGSDILPIDVIEFYEKSDKYLDYVTENIRSISGKQVIFTASFGQYESIAKGNSGESIFIMIMYDYWEEEYQSHCSEYFLPMLSFGLIPQTYKYKSRIGVYWYNPSIKKMQLLTAIPYKEEKSKWCINFLRPWRWNDEENNNYEIDDEVVKAIDGIFKNK